MDAGRFDECRQTLGKTVIFYRNFYFAADKRGLRWFYLIYYPQNPRQSAANLYESSLRQRIRRRRKP
jgi:hypothetical protein